LKKSKINNLFIERSIIGALDFIKSSLFAEEYALKPGFLQRSSPRLKIFFTIFFLALALFSKSILLLAALYLFCLFLGALSKVGLAFFLKRSLTFVPVFAFFIALPAIFQIFSPGDVIFSFSFLGSAINITSQGLNSASIFFMRVLVSVSYTILLTLVTRHFQILKALRVMGVSRIFIMTLGICYRYIYLFVDIVLNTYSAVKSRSGRIFSQRKGQKIVASGIASLWQRSYQMQAEVYRAMLSRGFTGEPKAYDI